MTKLPRIGERNGRFPDSDIANKIASTYAFEREGLQHARHNLPRTDKNIGARIRMMFKLDAD